MSESKIKFPCAKSESKIKETYAHSWFHTLQSELFRIHTLAIECDKDRANWLKNEEIEAKAIDLANSVQESEEFKKIDKAADFESYTDYRKIFAQQIFIQGILTKQPSRGPDSELKRDLEICCHADVILQRRLQKNKQENPPFSETLQ